MKVVGDNLTKIRKEVNSLETLAGSLGILLLQVGIYILNGLALKLLWGWFFVQLGLPEIGLAHAVGIGLTISYLTHQYIKNDEDWNDVIAYQVATPLVAVITGWIVQLFL